DSVSCCGCSRCFCVILFTPRFFLFFFFNDTPTTEIYTLSLHDALPIFNIANVWVSAALRLEEKDLKLMSRLARAQAKLVPGGSAARPEAVEIREEMQYATA